MNWSILQFESYEKDLYYFVSDLCREWGFCDVFGDIEYLYQKEAWAADEFASEILRLEGMNGDEDRRWRRDISRVFALRFGNEITRRDYDAP